MRRPDHRPAISAAADTGAKIPLVGDDAQLTAGEAGGTFAELARDRGDLLAELTDVRRFESDWEKTASLRLRVGDPVAIDDHQSHGRVIEGPEGEVLAGLYQGWKADTDAGLSSLMIAPDLATVAELNRNARADLVTTGKVSVHGIETAGGATVGIGDIVITRQNDRRLWAGDHWVRNGDRWTVTAVGADQSITVRGIKGGASVVLPAAYVREEPSGR